MSRDWPAEPHGVAQGRTAEDGRDQATQGPPPFSSFSSSHCTWWSCQPSHVVHLDPSLPLGALRQSVRTSCWSCLPASPSAPSLLSASTMILVQVLVPSHQDRLQWSPRSIPGPATAHCQRTDGRIQALPAPNPPMAPIFPPLSHTPSHEEAAANLASCCS